MFSTKNLVLRLEDIPSKWVFENYLSINLNHGSVRIKSPFNTADKDPSFIVFQGDDGEFKFCDFSASIKGDKVTLVKSLYNLSAGEAINKIISDYGQTGLGKVINPIVDYAKWKVASVQYRKWEEKDTKYWNPYGISLTALESHNIRPVDLVKMEKSNSSLYKSFLLSDHLMYAYLDAEDKIGKIYSPLVTQKKRKFITVRSNFIHGLDQLTYSQPYLCIGSSMKDILVMKRFGFNIDYVAPQSEGIMISSLHMNHWIKKYKKVFTLFDNDEAGEKSIQAYKENYKIPGFTLKLSKDVAQSVLDYEPKIVYKELIKEITKVLHNG